MPVLASRPSRRRFLQGSLALAAGSWLAACRSKIPRLGFLATRPVAPSRLEAFQEGLRALGYVEGQTIAIEYREADQVAQLGELAAELVNLPVDLILAANGPSAAAAKQVTSTVPIVMATSANAVEVGLVANLAHPGGNLTGLTIDNIGFVTKNLELLKAFLPGLT